MSQTLRGWTGDTFTLIAGCEGLQLTVPRGILEEIPYFQAALKSGDSKESQTRTFNLAEYDAHAIADTIHFVYNGTVEPLPESSSVDHNAVKKHVRAYIVADRWKLETIANKITDVLVDYHDLHAPHPEILSILRVAHFEDSLIYRFFIESIAYHTADRRYKDWKDDSSETAKDACEAYTFLTQRDLVEIALAIQILPLCVCDCECGPQDRKPLCSWHKHDLTETCASGDQSEDGMDEF